MCQLLSHVWLSNSMDCSPPGSSVHGVFQTRILKWVAIPFRTFLTQGSNLDLPHRGQILTRPEPPGKHTYTSSTRSVRFTFSLRVKSLRIFVFVGLTSMLSESELYSEELPSERHYVTWTIRETICVQFTQKCSVIFENFNSIILSFIMNPWSVFFFFKCRVLFFF